MYLIDNQGGDNQSFYLVDIEFFSSGGYIIDRLENYKFYLHRNFANASNSNATNENLMLGGQLDIRLTNSLKLLIDFQNVFYDINQDIIVEDIKVFNLQIKYNLRK